MLLSLKRSLREEICSLPRLWVNLRTACGCPLQGAGKLSISRSFLMVIGQPKTSVFYHHIYPHSPMTVDMMVNMTVNMMVNMMVKPTVLLPRCQAGRLASSGLRLLSRWTRSSRCKSGASGGSCGALTNPFFRVFFATLRIVSKRLLRTP